MAGSEDSLKVGIIGFGYWGVNITRNFLANPDVDEVFVADLNPSRLERAKRMFPAVQAVNSASTLFENPAIDIIAVVTPVSTHYELAKQALEKGKHVFVEKPMASNIHQAADLVRLAHQKKLVLAVDHTFLFTGAVRKIKELIETKHLGDLWYFDSVRINLGLFQHDVNVLWDLATHDLSILMHLTSQRPVEISAQGMAHSNSGMEDIAYLTLHYPNNFIAHVHVNWVAPTKIRQVILGGSERMLVWDDLDPGEKLKVYDKGISVEPNALGSEALHKVLIKYRTGDVWSPNLESTEALTGMISNFTKCIKSGEPLVSSGKLGLEVVALLEAAQKSLHSNGNRVQVQYPREIL